MTPLDVGRWAGATALLVAPHPDDEAVGCGGTVRRLVEAGCAVGVVVLADGAGGVDGRASAAERIGESTSCCAILGTRPPRFAGLSSAALRRDPADAARRLTELAGARAADLVLVPAPLERHATHRAALLAALLSDVARPGAAWWGYGVWDAIPAVADAAEVDVTAQRSVKTRAIAAHRSQEGGRAIGAGIAARDLSQAVFSRITGDESRKAVERLLDLSGLAPLPDPAAGSAERAGAHVASWLLARQQRWTAELWPGTAAG